MYIVYTWGWEVASTHVPPCPPYSSGTSSIAAPAARSARATAAGMLPWPPPSWQVPWCCGEADWCSHHAWSGQMKSCCAVAASHVLPGGGCGLLPSFQWSNRGVLRHLQRSPRAGPFPNNFQHCGSSGDCMVHWVLQMLQGCMPSLKPLWEKLMERTPRHVT